MITINFNDSKSTLSQTCRYFLPKHLPLPHPFLENFHSNRYTANKQVRSWFYLIFTVDPHQISIHYEHAEPVHIDWDEVYSVSYYKIDCIEYEIGYLVIDLVHGEFIEINDSDQDWEKIVNDLEKYLPSQTSDWRHSLCSWSINDGILYLYEKA